jgi:hypothetical protein
LITEARNRGTGIASSMSLRAARAFVATLAMLICLLDTIAIAQDLPSKPSEEIVADLAAGRVVIAVVKDAIIVGTVENPIEAETRPPTPVAISTTRLGVILGADRWFSPSTRQDLARLDQELPQLRSHLVATHPHLQDAQGGGEATDMETIGQALLERLTNIAQSLHGKIELPPNEPIVELIIADFLSGYGPEVWQLSYGLKQEEEQTDYWTTRILNPAFLQYWPPEKGQPQTLIEFTYPPENPSPTLLELLRRKDPRLQALSASDAKMGAVASRLLNGESKKILSVDAVQFLRAALAATTPPNCRETLAIIREESGFEWILAPPAEPKAPSTLPDRPADAPTLVH